ncbi:7389_t:CDS:2, partial [Gigaspora rosea]
LTAENAELKDRVTKLEQKQTQVITNDQDASSTKDILQSMACSELSVNTQIQAQSIISSEIIDESKRSLFIQFSIESQPDNKKDNNSDHLPELEHSPTRPESLAESETPKSSLSQDTINDNSVEILEFVETIYKENITYEDRIDEIKYINKIDDQTTRMLVYYEIKTLLSDITDVNLRQKTFIAKKIYILLTGIGIEQVRAMTSSASAVSSLTDNQIQDIINCFSKKSTKTEISALSKKVSSEDIINEKDESLPEEE